MIRPIGELKTSDPMSDAKIMVPGEKIDHHVEEEDVDMFSKAHKTALISMPSMLYYCREIQDGTEHGLPAMPA